MKIITKTTFVVGKGKVVEPGEIVDMDKEEALSLIERGLAELPQAKVDETDAKEEADAKAKVEVDESAGAAESAQ